MIYVGGQDGAEPPDGANNLESGQFHDVITEMPLVFRARLLHELKAMSMRVNSTPIATDVQVIAAINRAPGAGRGLGQAAQAFQRWAAADRALPVAVCKRENVRKRIRPAALG
jgi:hypothetical protein